MSLKNTIQYALTKVKYMFSEARIIPDSGLIIAGLILRSFGFDKKVDKLIKKGYLDTYYEDIS